MFEESAGEGLKIYFQIGSFKLSAMCKHKTCSSLQLSGLIKKYIFKRKVFISLLFQYLKSFNASCNITQIVVKLPVLYKLFCVKKEEKVAGRFFFPGFLLDHRFTATQV